MKTTHKKGFTLIELLMVMAIIGVLATAIVLAINPAKRLAQARDSKRRSDLAAIGRAIQGYSVDTLGKVPFCRGGIGVRVCKITETTNFCIKTVDPGCFADFEPYYLKHVPQDPKNNGTDCSAPPGTDRKYVYCYRPEPFNIPPLVGCTSNDTCTGFLLYACEEDADAVIDNKFVFTDNSCTTTNRNFAYFIPPDNP